VQVGVLERTEGGNEEGEEAMTKEESTNEMAAPFIEAQLARKQREVAKAEMELQREAIALLGTYLSNPTEDIAATKRLLAALRDWQADKRRLSLETEVSDLADALGLPVSLFRVARELTPGKEQS